MPQSVNRFCGKKRGWRRSIKTVDVIHGGPLELFYAFRAKCVIMFALEGNWPFAAPPQSAPSSSVMDR